MPSAEDEFKEMMAAGILPKSPEQRWTEAMVHLWKKNKDGHPFEINFEYPVFVNGGFGCDGIYMAMDLAARQQPCRNTGWYFDSPNPLTTPVAGFYNFLTEWNMKCIDAKLSVVTTFKWVIGPRGGRPENGEVHVGILVDKSAKPETCFADGSFKVGKYERPPYHYSGSDPGEGSR